MLALQIYNENKKPLRLFTAKGSVRMVALKYYEKYPEERRATRYLSYRRRMNNQIIFGTILEMDKM